MSLRDPAYAGSWQSSWDRRVAYAPRDDIEKIAQFRLKYYKFNKNIRKLKSLGV